MNVSYTEREIGRIVIRGGREEGRVMGLGVKLLYETSNPSVGRSVRSSSVGRSAIDS